MTDTCDEVAECEQSTRVSVNISVRDRDDEPTVYKTDGHEKCELQFGDEDSNTSDFYDLQGILVEFVDLESVCEDQNGEQSVLLKFRILHSENSKSATVAADGDSLNRLPCRNLTCSVPLKIGYRNNTKIRNETCRFELSSNCSDTFENSKISSPSAGILQF